MTALRHFSASAAAALLLLALSGCGLFTPATPEDPTPETGRPLPILTVDPESVLVSLEIGLETEDINFYMHAFSDSLVNTDVAYHAFFDFQDIADYQLGGGQPPNDWQHTQENTFAPQFFGLRPVAYDVYLTQDPNRPDIDVITNQEVIYYRRYRIWSQADPVAIGLADLRIQRVGVSGEWKIVHWVDRRDTTATGILTLGKRRLESL